MPGTILNFDGIPFPGVACNCAPPDTNGAVGLTQYVQIVNEGYQVFDKGTGISTFGPVGISAIWSGFGGVCETAGHGDPVVLYDKLANRWVVSQFAGSVPTDECIAVSTSSDATGSYNRYGFHLGSNFFDYPKLATWPDAYYMAMNVFNSSGTSFLGPQPYALDRAKMLAGMPATFVSTGLMNPTTRRFYLPTSMALRCRLPTPLIRLWAGPVVSIRAITRSTTSTSTSRHPQTQRSRCSPLFQRPDSQNSVPRRERVCPNRTAIFWTLLVTG
jgi:hypothetical protein